MFKPYLKYASKLAINNPLMAAMYTLAYPTAKVFNKIGITPNAVTAFSFIFAILAFFSLLNERLDLFFVFWFVAYLLDFVDGTLARMTANERKKALRIDHMSDLLKISLLFLGFGLYFDSAEIWMLTFISSTGYLFYSILNHDLGSVQKIISLQEGASEGCNQLNKDNSNGLSAKERIIGSLPFGRNFFSLIYNVIFVINGHTLIIFFFIPLGKNIASIILIYFCLVVFLQSFLRIKSLSTRPRV